MNILVVDDEDVVTGLLFEVLTDMGFAVTTAKNGEMAVEQMEGGHYDIAFVDLNMPGMDGLSLIKHLRSNYPETHPIVITGYSHSDLAQKALSAGAVTCFYKPFDIISLCQTVFDLGTRLNAQTQAAM